MIIKKVTAKKTGAAKSKALHVRDLCDYIAGPDAGDEREKVEHRGSVNLLNLDHAAQVQEISDLAETATRSPQPLQHWIMSWRQGEQPTAAQADRAVAIFLEEMGLSGHQAIYALHRDTDNWHLHLAVNRVHPETERVVTVNNGFDLEVAHRAIARIEHEQGWRRERGGRYQILENDLVHRVGRTAAPEREPSAPARDFENLTGQKSAQRTVIQEGAELMRRARSWRELHELLHERDMRFDKKGSGAILTVGETAVKASTAGRDCSLSALEKRLGAFQPSHMTPKPRRRAPEPVAPAAPRWDEYIAGRQAHHAAKKQERGLLGDRQREEWGGMTGKHRKERERIFAGSWRGKGELLNAFRSALAARHAQEKAALRERHQREREAWRERHPQWPGFEEWLRERKSPDRAEKWRFRQRKPALIFGDRDDRATPRDIRAFEGEARGWDVVYRRTGSPRQAPAFVDHGRRISIHDEDKATTLAALQLAEQKWSRLYVSGPEDYKRRCVELAAEHGFRIANPELQQAIADERERRLARNRPSPGRAEPRREEVADHEREPVRDSVEAYERHFAEIRRQHPGADVSRVDAQVAVCLRATGHLPSEVERAIREGAAKERPQERRNWAEYAMRATAHAYSTPGDQAVERLKSFHFRLLAVEGREPRKELERNMPAFRGRDRDFDIGR